VRARKRRGAALGMAAVAVAALLSGCGGEEETEEERIQRVLKAIIKEYRPRFEQRRAALTAAASQLPKGSPRKVTCHRELDPRPEFFAQLHPHPLPPKQGNVDIALANEASAPERIVEDPGRALRRFAVAPSWLIRGLWITGPQGPLGTDHFEVGSNYAYEPYEGVEKDPAKRLRQVLGIGLQMRYVLLFRVTTYHDGDNGEIEKAVVKADVFLADLEKRDIPCRLTASGRPLYVAPAPIGWSSGTPYEDMQSSFQLNIKDKLRTLAERKK